VLSSDGRRLYVANLDSHEITIIDTRSREAVGRVATGKAPVRVVLSPDGKQLIYALLRDKQVGFADVDTRQQVATVDLEGEPGSMNLSADGRWALTAAQDIDTVYVISIADRAVVHQFKTAEGAGPDPVLEIAPPRKQTAIRPGLLAADVRDWFPVPPEWTH
jgi:YVTN family beta-propeller protein